VLWCMAKGEAVGRSVGGRAGSAGRAGLSWGDGDPAGCPAVRPGQGTHLHNSPSRRTMNLRCRNLPSLSHGSWIQIVCIDAHLEKRVQLSPVELKHARRPAPEKEPPHPHASRESWPPKHPPRNNKAKRERLVWLMPAEAAPGRPSFFFFFFFPLSFGVLAGGKSVGSLARTPSRPTERVCVCERARQTRRADGRAVVWSGLVCPPDGGKRKKQKKKITDIGG
jgi:hypothetical protein